MYFVNVLGNYAATMDRCVQHNPHHCVDGHYTSVLEHTKLVYDALPESAPEILRLTAILHDVGKPAVRTVDEKGDRFFNHAKASSEIADKLLHENTNLSEENIAAVLTLIETHDNIGGLKAIKKFRNRHGDYLTRLHLVFRYADIMGQTPEERAGKLEELAEAFRCYEALAEADL